MGEHEWRCDACGQTYVYFNSRGNRHCPACREAYRQQWAEKLEQDLLPVPYHHLMLTLPRPLTRVSVHQFLLRLNRRIDTDLGTGYWVLSTEYWVLSTGYWVLSTEY
ncbi:MAG: transposase zinc-binding domain-containing protein [Planctomycetota bacterium]